MKPTLYLKRLVYYIAIKRNCEERYNLGLIGVGNHAGAQGILDAKEDFCLLIQQQGGSFQQLSGFVLSPNGLTHFGNGAGFVGWKNFGSQNAVITYLKRYFTLVECVDEAELEKHTKYSPEKTKRVTDKVLAMAKPVSPLSKVLVLLKIGFEDVAQWEIRDRRKLIDVGDDDEVWAALKQPKNALYAFCSDDDVFYIGKTARSLEKRFTGYRDPGNTQATNRKCHDEIRKLIQNGRVVRILVLPDQTHLHWGDFRISLAAGMEDSLVERLQPRLNGKNSKVIKTESEQLEELAEKLASV